MNTVEKEKNPTLTYALVQGLFWMIIAAGVGFVSVYLLEMGFNNTQIGILIAAAGALTAILQPVVASYADRPSSPSIKNIMLIICIIVLGMTILLLLNGGYNFLTGLLYGGDMVLLQLMIPLVNSLGMESINQGKKLNFGIARGMGSLCYAVTAYGLGLLAADFGVKTIPFSIIIILAGLMLLLNFFPFQKGKERKETAKNSGGLICFFKRYQMFCFTLCGCVLIYVSHLLINSFAFQIVQSKGGGSSEMGFILALAAVLELPTMFLFTWMLKKAKADVWLRISGIFYMIKTLSTLLAPTITVLYFVQAFQMFGFALYTVSSVYYVNSIMEEQDAIKGQAYMTMTNSLGSVLGALIGGGLLDAAGTTAMLIFATAAAAVGMTIVLLTVGRRTER